MRIITFSGTPSVGKTSVITHLIKEFEECGVSVGVVKFDCLTTEDDETYRSMGVPVLTGISGNVCPDHFYVSNVIPCVEWGKKIGLDLLIMESAGLCNRCSPHLQEAGAVCVIDNLMGVKTPRKVGPMLKKADVIVITKADIVSQAEREVFAFYVQQSNPKAAVIQVNGNTGQGCAELMKLLEECPAECSHLKLRFSMPAAVCSYCLGERNIREEYTLGTMRGMNEL